MIFDQKKLIELGFKDEHDGTGDPRGTDWNITNSDFRLLIDAYCDVYLSRMNPDSDQIKIVVDDYIDLQMVIDFIE